VEDVEYLPQRSLGTRTLVKACTATAIAVILFSVGNHTPGLAYLGAIPALAAIGWFASYAIQRRYRCRLTPAGIATRRLRTRFVPWTEIRDVQVVQRVQVAEIAVRGSRAAGRYGSTSGAGARKIASIRLQAANGRWRELPLPVAREDAPDSDFMSKAAEIRDRWRAVTSRAVTRTNGDF
jgi:hypothetical protein